MKRFKVLGSYLLVLSLLLSVNVSAADVNLTDGKDVNINVSSEATQVGGRVIQVDHTVSITGEVEVPDVVLSLDRSGSMLFKVKEDGVEQGYVVDYILPDLRAFVKDYFDSNPSGRIGLAIFGKRGAEINGGNYYTSAQKTNEAIDLIYDYKVKNKDKNNESVDWVNTYRDENNNKVEKNTNVQDGFKEAEDMVLRNIAAGNDNNAVLLFSDGAANTYYDANGNLQYTNAGKRLASITQAEAAGQSLQKHANVFTVGYFGAITNASKNEVAQTMMKNSQNAGVFTTNSLNQVDEMFAKVMGALGVVGTNAVLKDYIQPGFEVIDPVGGKVKTDTTGTYIEWEIGNLYLTGNDPLVYSYKIKAKDDFYPSGTSGMEVALNDAAKPLSGLTLEDKGEKHTVDVEQLYEPVEPHDTLPSVELEVTYDNLNIDGVADVIIQSEAGSSGTRGFLLGDKVRAVHKLSYDNYLDIAGNEVVFDFMAFEPQLFNETIGATAYSEYVTVELFESANGTENFVPGEPEAATETDIEVSYGPDNVVEDQDTENVTWEDEIIVDMTMIKTGTFYIDQLMTFKTTNLLENDFQQEADYIAEDFEVRSGDIHIQFIDEAGQMATGIDMIVVSDKAGFTPMRYSDYGIVTPDAISVGTAPDPIIDYAGYKVYDVPSGVYKVAIDLPDTYAMPAGHGLELTTDVDGGNYYEGVEPGLYLIDTYNKAGVDTEIALSYTDFTIDLGNFGLKNVDISDLSVTTATGDSSTMINKTYTQLKVLVNFRPQIDLDFLALNIVDTYTGDDDVKDPEDGQVSFYYDAAEFKVTFDDAGTITEVPGFSLSTGNVIIYNPPTPLPGEDLQYLKEGVLYTAHMMMDKLPAYDGTPEKAYEALYDLTVDLEDSKYSATTSNALPAPDAVVTPLNMLVDLIPPKVSAVFTPSDSGTMVGDGSSLVASEKTVEATITIESTFTGLIEYKVIRGDDFTPVNNGDGIKPGFTDEEDGSIADRDTYKHTITGDLEVDPDGPEPESGTDGVYTAHESSKNELTVKVVDEAGNETVETIIILVVVPNFEGLY